MPRLTSLGVSLQYAVETSAGVRPTTGYKKVPEIKSVPSFNPEPSTIESTTLEETEYKTYEPGLKDLGGALPYTANLTPELLDFWDDLMAEFETAEASGLAMWFAIVHPKLDRSVYYAGVPSPIGVNEISVESMYETTLYITARNAPEWFDAPTV